MKDAFCRVCQVAQRKLPEIKDAWLCQKADEIQAFADKHDIKNFYSAFQAVCGPVTSATAPIRSSDGSRLITEKEKILDC